MSTQLGTLEELPQDFRDRMGEAGVSPLWPMMRNVLPHDVPQPVTKPGHWKYEEIRPLLLRAGELTPVEKAERRVLVLNDPGRKAANLSSMQVTSSIYIGLQLLLPGETAPAHRHSPSAARIVVEGKGAYTVVNGEKCSMSRGDLILTPGGQWHDHGHDGTEPVIWLDALDLPLFVYLEGSYAIEGELQAPRNRPDASEVEFKSAGLVPVRRSGEVSNPYPLLRYPWENTRAALVALRKYSSESAAVELAYVNPETGLPCLPTMGFTAMMIPSDSEVAPLVKSTSAVFHAVEGQGRSAINGTTMHWREGDTFSAPVFSKVMHASEGAKPAFLIRIDDAPLQTKLGFYEERGQLP
jgi:gentisate 1,2-dioxygenase